jgi:hypothetical protein
MRGDRPTEGQFDSLLDSTVNIADDRYLLGLRTYDPSKVYIVGDTMIYSDGLFRCIANTTGVFNPACWQPITTLGAVIYAGAWNASSNFPTLVDGVGTKGFYYVVSVGGVQNLGSGPIDFQVSDWAIYNGTIWQKVDNSQIPVVAADVEFTPNGDITSANVQDAIVEVRNDTDIKLAAKQDLITLTPNYFPYADTANSLADGALINESDGVVLDSGKVFRSIVPGKSQIDFPAADAVIISTDGGAGAEGVLLLDTDTASIRRTGYGELYISAGPDALGEIHLLNNNGSNGITINNELVHIINSQGQGGSIDIASDGKIDVQSDLFRVNSPATTLNSTTITLNALTSSTVPYLDGSKNLLSSSVTPAELNYLSGTSSAIQTQLNAKLNLAGGTMTGNLVLNADPTAALQASTKQYVDAVDSNLQSQLNSKLDLSGGTMTGDLVLHADPTAAMQPATKQYVDGVDSDLQSQINDKLDLAGGTITGNLLLNANPSVALGAATKQYVDSADSALQSQIDDKLDLSGGTLTGNLLLNANPSAALGAATKQYVDSADSALQLQIDDKLDLAGGTMTGNLVLNADPTAAMQPATKQYVDGVDSNLQSQVNGKLNLTGGTLTGNLLLNANPSVALGAATKQYVDSADSALQLQINDKLNLAGGTMTGNLLLNANPSAALGAATKQYVDTGLASKQNSLGFTPVPDSRTINGFPLTSNVSISKADIGLRDVTNDQQLSQKFYFSDESTVTTSAATAFSTAYTNTLTIAVTGTYLIEWYYELAASTASVDVGSRVSFSATQISNSTFKPGVANAYVGVHGFYQRAFSAGLHTFLIEINRPSTSGTASFRRPRFTITKV